MHQLPSVSFDLFLFPLDQGTRILANRVGGIRQFGTLHASAPEKKKLQKEKKKLPKMPRHAVGQFRSKSTSPRVQKSRTGGDSPV